MKHQGFYDAFSIGKQGLASHGISTWLRFFFVYAFLSNISCHGKKLLDLGCSDGTFLLWTRETTDYVGVDINRQMLLSAKRRPFPYLGFVLADAENLPFVDNTFRIVCVCETLEHLTHRREGIKEIARVSSNHILVTVPTFLLFPFFATVFRHLLQRLSLAEEKNYFRSPEHKVEFFLIPFNGLVSLSSLVRDFSKNGYSTSAYHEIGFVAHHVLPLLKKTGLVAPPVLHPTTTITMMKLEQAFSKIHIPFGTYAVLLFSKQKS